MTKKPLVVLSGPTAVGKSKLSIALAKQIHGEIISCDSMQVYRGMNIGSAKITAEEMDQVPHYLIDVLDPTENFHVALLQTMAKDAMEQIYAHGNIPILVGGTGFYIQAILKDIDFSADGKDDNLRDELTSFAKEKGIDALFDKLREVDLQACESIHPNNVKRVIRALEYYYISGEKISVHNQKESQKQSIYDSKYLVLTNQREILYQNIDKRVNQMMDQGLLDKVRGLYDMGLTQNNISMQGLGYKELLEYLNGNGTLEDAVYKIKRDTRHFAKRQLTWFKREEQVIWIDKSEFISEEDILSYMLSHLPWKDTITLQ